MIEYEKIELCPYCSSRNIRLLFKAKDFIGKKEGYFFLSKCLNCGLYFQNPRVKEKDIADFYEPIGYFKAPELKYSKKSFWKHKTLANHFGYGKKDIFWLFSFIFKRFLKSKSYPCFKQNGSLLEIGCSNGELLRELADLGWRTKGIEMSGQSSLFAREKRRLDVDNKRVEECSFPEKTFDVVVMNMVLEHLYRPFEQLAKISFWLKPGGYIIFSIPYINGLEFKIFKECSYGLQLPTHITFFTKRIIRDYLKKLGFAQIRFYSQFFDRDIVASSQYKGGWFFKFLGYNKCVRLFLIKPFVLFLSLLGLSSRLTVFAQKQ